MACGNCTVKEDKEFELHLDCAALPTKQVGKKVSYNTCRYFKPEQQEIKMENTAWDLSPGKLVGQYVKYRSEKWLVWGDLRLVKKPECYPLKLYNENTCKYDITCIETISPWLEPEVLEERAQFLYGNTAGACMSVEVFTKERAEAWCKKMDLKLLKFPVGSMYKFNKAGELV